MNDTDMRALAQARATLEQPGFAAKLIEYAGTPVAFGSGFVPDKIKTQAMALAKTSLIKAVNVAVSTMSGKATTKTSNFTHKFAAAASGAVAGFAGFSALAAELPFTTGVILRSIADIARSQGEDLSQAETRLACLEVFALGSGNTDDPTRDLSYWAVRASLAKSMQNALGIMANSSVIDQTAPAVLAFISKIAARFGIVVGEKAAAQMVPILGAIGGATVNTLFMDHFQNLARAHFTIRRLERIYGTEVVKTAYTAQNPTA
ncbi:EcsC family protein [Desulfovibrio inopinatus]|uniref:EcsC family protein n=1 Tax=Desulfovibrio inopinatus TaxID=102109 RepID=UPI0004109A23|nr:EcsC family protein [Desulfovibrio inopinatus]